MPARILFVCTGNICRSPTAHALLAQKAEQVGVAVDVDSAGTSDYEQGRLMDKRSARELARRGYAPLAHRARQIEPVDFVRFDWIIGMTQTHCEDLMRLRAKTALSPSPAAALANIALMRDCEKGAPTGQDVPDPWFGEPQDFVRVFDMLDGCVEALLAEIEAAAAQARPVQLPAYSR